MAVEEVAGEEEEEAAEEEEEAAEPLAGEEGFVEEKVGEVGGQKGEEKHAAFARDGAGDAEGAVVEDVAPGQAQHGAEEEDEPESEGMVEEGGWGAQEEHENEHDGADGKADDAVGEVRGPGGEAAADEDDVKAPEEGVAEHEEEGGGCCTAWGPGAAEEEEEAGGGGEEAEPEEGIFGEGAFGGQ